MQELAPVVLFIALYVVLVVAAFLTLIGSSLLIWRYQRGVAAAMLQGGIDTPPDESSPPMTLPAESSAFARDALD